MEGSKCLASTTIDNTTVSYIAEISYVVGRGTHISNKIIILTHDEITARGIYESINNSNYELHRENEYYWFFTNENYDVLIN